MKAKKSNASKSSQKLTVKNPARLSDFVRIYRINKSTLKGAKKLVQEALCPAA